LYQTLFKYVKSIMSHQTKQFPLFGDLHLDPTNIELTVQMMFHLFSDKCDHWLSCLRVIILINNFVWWVVWILHTSISNGRNMFEVNVYHTLVHSIDDQGQELPWLTTAGISLLIVIGSFQPAKIQCVLVTNSLSLSTWAVKGENAHLSRKNACSFTGNAFLRSKLFLREYC